MVAECFLLQTNNNPTMAPCLPFCLGVTVTLLCVMSLFTMVVIHSWKSHNDFRKMYEPIIAENNIYCINRENFEHKVAIMRNREQEQFGKVKTSILKSKLFFRGYQTDDICLPFAIIEEVHELWEISKAKHNGQQMAQIDEFQKQYETSIDLLTDLLILDAFVNSLNKTNVQNGKRETFLKPSNKRDVDLQNETQLNVTNDVVDVVVKNEPETDIIEV